MNRDSGAGLGVLGVVGPGIRGALHGHFCRVPAGWEDSQFCQAVPGLFGQCADSTTDHFPAQGEVWGNGWTAERLAPRGAFLTWAAGAAEREPGLGAGRLHGRVRRKDAMRPSKGQRTRLADTVLMGTVARRSSRTSRIPCGETPGNAEGRGREWQEILPLEPSHQLPKKKRKILDMANKKRNTSLVLRGGLCLQFFPPRRGPLVSRAAALHNPRQHSFLLAPMRQAQNQGPVIRQATPTQKWMPRRALA